MDNDSVLGALSSCEDTLLLIHELSPLARMTFSTTCGVFPDVGDVDEAVFTLTAVSL